MDYLDSISYEDAILAYDEILDDCEGPIMIAGSIFSASAILKELDPVAYREGLMAYYDCMDIEVV
jgi:hypothetical protein